MAELLQLKSQEHGTIYLSRIAFTRLEFLYVREDNGGARIAFNQGIRELNDHSLLILEPIDVVVRKIEDFLSQKSSA